MRPSLKRAALLALPLAGVLALALPHSAKADCGGAADCLGGDGGGDAAIGGAYGSQYAYGPDTDWSTRSYSSGAVYAMPGGQDFLNYTHPPDYLRRGPQAEAAGRIDPYKPDAVPDPYPKYPSDYAAQPQFDQSGQDGPKPVSQHGAGEGARNPADDDLR